MKIFEGFAEYIEKVDESFKSPVLKKLMASADKFTRETIKDIYSKDGVAISELTEDDVLEFNAWSPSDVRGVLKKGREAKVLQTWRKRYEPTKRRRIFAVDKQENIILATGYYDENKNEIEFDFSSTGENIKNLKSFFDDYVDKKYFGKDRQNLSFILVRMPSDLEVRNIETAKSEKELQHLFKRESKDFFQNLSKEKEKIKSDIISVIEKISGVKNLSKSRIAESSGEVDLGEFGHGFRYTLTGKERWGEINSDTPISDINIEFNMGTLGSFKPKENKLLVDTYKTLVSMSEAAMNDTSDFKKFIESHLELNKLDRKAKEFTFEVDGRKYKKTYSGFQDITDEEK